MKKGILLIFCVLIGSQIFGQSEYRVGFLPSVNVNQKLNNHWRLNYRSEFRIIGATGTFGEANSSAPEYALTDLSVVAARKIGLNNSLAAGALLRIRGTELNYRFIQQYTIVKRYSGFRLAHRFSTDQTFVKNEPMTFRLRYRISTDFALNGETVDNNEFYIKINNEYLVSLKGNSADLEIRLVPFLGFAVNDDNKIELGLDYRIDGFLNNETRNNFWLSINWFLTI
jgi:hypothetical protein